MNSRTYEHWSKLLTDRIHKRTGGQLRQLRIHTKSNRVTIQAIAPSEESSILAEQAAKEILPAGRLLMSIVVNDNRPVNRVSEYLDEQPLAPSIKQESDEVGKTALSIFRCFNNVLNGN